MFDAFFTRTFAVVRAHKRWVLLGVAIITALSMAGLSFIRYEGNIDLMLPPEKDITRSLQFLRDSNLSDKIVISLAITAPDKGKKELFQAVDQLAAALKPPLFTKVMSGISMAGALEEFSVLQYAPQILGEEELARIDQTITAPFVSAQLKKIYLQSFRPESIFMSSLSRTDPLDIKLLLFGKLKALPASMGYDVAVEDGHFISRDRAHSMLIVQTSVPMMDSRQSKELVRVLEQELVRLPDYITSEVVGGHFHTVSNEKVIKRDIKVASVIASIAFLVLFLVVFRDPRAVFVFIIPLIAVVWSIIISTFVEGKLSYLVIGFGTAIAGISIDYGLLVYIAMKRGSDALQMVKLAKLVSIDAITTIFSFLVLYFSLIHGYHQLSLFSMLCVFICLVLSLFVLPLVLSWKHFTLVADPTIGDRLKKVNWPAKTIVAVWAGLTIIAGVLSFTVQFDSDVKKLDGSEQSVLSAEQHFHEFWGGKSNQAIFVAPGATLDDAMDLNDQVYREATQAIGPENFTSLALFWSSARTRALNVERWDRFWKAGREAKLRQYLKQASARYQFSDAAFSPFSSGLYAHQGLGSDPNGMLAKLQERFVVKKQDGYRVLSFFPDEQGSLDALNAIARKHPGAFIVSGRALSASISDFTLRETRLLVPLAILFNIVLSWMFFRNWTETFIALVPVLTGVVWLVGIMALFKMPLNVVNIIATIVTTGVIVDYGLGITYEYRYNLRIGTVIAVTLSAATNIIGAGVMLFAKHPALYSTGVAMVICMVSGYLSSVIVIPSLCSLLGTSQREGRRQ